MEGYICIYIYTKNPHSAQPKHSFHAQDVGDLPGVILNLALVLRLQKFSSSADQGTRS